MSNTHDMKHMKFLEAVTRADVTVLRQKEATYKGSWKRAGGRSAWFMFRRNMDRLIEMLKPPERPAGFVLKDLDGVVFNHDDMQYLKKSYMAEDIFEQIEINPSGDDSTVLACLRDLRRYAILVEAEMMSRGVVPSGGGESARFVEEQQQAREMVVEEIDFYAVLASKMGIGRREAEEWWLRIERSPAYVRGANVSCTTERPGTPEDGGQHASLAPWQVTSSYFSEQRIGDTLASIFWKSLGMSGNYVLEAYVQSSALPRELRDYYHLRGDSWVVKIEKCPEELRDCFPRFQIECNTKEWEDMPAWVRPLYTHHDQMGKYRLAEINMAWGRET